MQLVTQHVTFVQHDRKHIVLPWPSRPTRKNAKVRVFCRNRIDVTGMTIVQPDPIAPRETLAIAGQSRVDQHWQICVDGRLIKRIPDRIAWWIARVLLTDHCDSDEPGLSGHRAL